MRRLLKRNTPTASYVITRFVGCCPARAAMAMLPGPTERLTWQWWGSHAQDAARAQNLWGDDKVTALIGGPFTEEEVASRLAAEVAGGAADRCQYWPIFMAGHARRGAKHVGVAGLRRYTGAVEGCTAVYEIGFHL